MTDDQWVQFSEALQVAYSKCPLMFRDAVEAMPEEVKNQFMATVFNAAADVLGPTAGAALQRVAELRDAAKEAADPKSDAYAYPPVTGAE